MSNTDSSKNKRVIILGAGASVECGFYPLGRDFLEIAKSVAEHAGSKAKTSKEEFYTDLSKALKDFCASNPTSIDTYISRIANGKHQEILKAFIFATISVCNFYSLRNENLFRSWYFKLSELFLPNSNAEEEGITKLKNIQQASDKIDIITFNYDISLELFLAERVRNYFNKDSGKEMEEAFRVICKKIHHVYGSILHEGEEINHKKIFDYKSETRKDESQTLLDQSDCKKELLPYLIELEAKEERSLENFFISMTDLLKNKIPEGGSVEPIKTLSFILVPTVESILLYQKELTLEEKITSRIQTIHDERKVKDLDKYKKITADCDVLYILGYGFDETNNKLLGIERDEKNDEPKIKWKKGCYITNHSGNQNEINQKIERLIYEKLSVPVPPLNNPRWRVPIISYKSVSDALQGEFALDENPDPRTHTIETNLSPYLAMKK